jgi:hypothetical protein
MIDIHVSQMLNALGTLLLTFDLSKQQVFTTSDCLKAFTASHTELNSS